MNPTLVIMTGPQGSGNHLFSKVFGSNPNYYCWPELQDNYWVGHDAEPFADAWKYPKLLSKIAWAKHAVWFTSISCPYFDNGVEKVPYYANFIHQAKSYATVKIMVIGRDQNILEHQQTRVRGRHTTGLFKQHLHSLNFYEPIYASQEMLYLYGINYVNSLEKQLGIDSQLHHRDTTAIDKIIEVDANRKYLRPIEHNWLDEEIKIASSKRD